MQRTQAVKLLNAAEMKLYDNSRAAALRKLSASELDRAIERTRKLRDKQRDLVKRQRLATRKRTGAKGGPSGDANQRTEAKGELIAEILERFEARRAEVSAKAEPARPAPKRPPDKKTPVRKAAKKTTKKAKRAARKAKAAAGKADPTARPASQRKQGKKKAARKVAKKAAKKVAKKAAAKKKVSGAPKSTRAQAAEIARRARAKRLGSSSAPEAAAPNPGEANPSKGQPAAPGFEFVDPRAKSANRRRQPENARQRSIQAHIGARGKRSQARRDSR